jgi:hypothetical protein
MEGLPWLQEAQNNVAGNPHATDELWPVVSTLKMVKMHPWGPQGAPPEGLRKEGTAAMMDSGHGSHDG